MTKHKYKKVEYKSKGEYEIAKFLDKHNIEFEYEFPIAVIDQDKPKLWYPDFYLKEYQVVVEYFGMYNYNEGYKEAADHKKAVFQKCGIQFVPIYHITKNWKEYLLKTILTHQEIKVKKINSVMDKFKPEDPKFVKRLKSFLINK